MKSLHETDILVIGAGPAGLMACIAAAEKGVRVCLVERRADVGAPVRCGEGTSHSGIERVLHVEKHWIKSEIDTVHLVSPSGIKVVLKNIEKSYILDRDKMEHEMLDRAIRAGVFFKASCAITSIVRSEDGSYLCSSNSDVFCSRCVIIADGVESNVARCLGWDTALELKDIETCAFARISHERIVPNTAVLYTGRKYAPGGYAWVFPRGENEANIGLGMLGIFSEGGKALKCLNAFIEEQFRGAKVYDLHCAGVPVAKWLKPLVRDGAMVVGDAARQVNCVNGGGIAYALYAGKTAGTVAAQAFKNGKFSTKHLKEYQKSWESFYGKQQIRSFALKEMIIKCNDDFLDMVAGKLSNSKSDTLSYFSTLAAAFSRHPILLLKAFLLFGWKR